jgi:FKBP-type peptidyl-prolyl cis-trans isomerase FkpA
MQFIPFKKRSTRDYKPGLVAVLFFFLVFNSCGDSGEYPGFDIGPSGLPYQFVERVKDRQMVRIGDIVEMELLYKNQQDSVLFNSKELRTAFRMKVLEPSHQGGCFEDAVFMCGVGEKISFIIPVDSFYSKTRRMPIPEGVESGTDLFFDLKVKRVISPEEVEKERELFIKTNRDQENLMIKSYLTDNKIDAKPQESGLYYIPKKNGKGKMAKSGNKISVHYIGKFIDGREFDSSYKRNEPFEFELGAEQVIEAWELACKNMRVGDMVLIITPSSLAYGAGGYGKLIPPFTPLVFEIEMLGVK